MGCLSSAMRRLRRGGLAMALLGATAVVASGCVARGEDSAATTGSRSPVAREGHRATPKRKPKLLRRDNPRRTATSRPNVESIWGCAFDSRCFKGCASASRIKTLKASDPKYGRFTYRRLTTFDGDELGSPGTTRCESDATSHVGARATSMGPSSSFARVAASSPRGSSAPLATSTSAAPTGRSSCR